MHMLDNEPTTQVICNFRLQWWHDYKEIRENDFFKVQRDGILCVLVDEDDNEEDVVV